MGGKGGSAGRQATAGSQQQQSGWQTGGWLSSRLAGRRQVLRTTRGALSMADRKADSLAWRYSRTCSGTAAVADECDSVILMHFM